MAIMKISNGWHFGAVRVISMVYKYARIMFCRLWTILQIKYRCLGCRCTSWLDFEDFYVIECNVRRGGGCDIIDTKVWVHCHPCGYALSVVEMYEAHIGACPKMNKNLFLFSVIWVTIVGLNTHEEREPRPYLFFNVQRTPICLSPNRQSIGVVNRS